MAWAARKRGRPVITLQRDETREDVLQPTLFERLLLAGRQRGKLGRVPTVSRVVGLARDGHFVVECVHNCAHAQPPLEAAPGSSVFAPLWRFALDHPYWLPDGTSPWQEAGMPAGTPGWCAMGAGAARMRGGECESGPLGDCN